MHLPKVQMDTQSFYESLKYPAVEPGISDSQDFIQLTSLIKY